MAGSQIPTGITILNSYLGYFGVSLTNFSTSASTAIAAGSKVEVAGAFFTFSSDDTPDATSWTAITTATTAYIQLEPSGTAGSQILTSSWTSTTPVWSTSKQGWYTSSGSNIRIVASAYKTSATQYDRKTLINYVQVAPTNFGATTFTASGSFTVPSSITRLYITGTAAGGNGGDGGSGGGAGGGGGGGCGEFCIKYPVTVIAGEVITITIGGAGANTTLVGGLSATVLTLIGGSNGANGVTTSGGAGGTGAKSGGAGGNGGANGVAGSCLMFGTGGGTASGGYGGGGGGAQAYPTSVGGNGGNGGVAGVSATGYGAGGGGGGGTFPAGVGGGGLIVIEW